MAVTVYGASDDLIEVEGDVYEEFAYRDGTYFLGFSDGTVLSIRYGDEGMWRIATVSRGASTPSLVQAADVDDDYSDRMTLDGDIRWVVVGRDFVGRS